MVYLLSEEIQTGKTESLQLCTENRKDVGGFLSPEKSGKRYLLNLKSRQEITFEVDLTSYAKSIEFIGKYALAKSSFAQAGSWVKDHLSDQDIKCIILDEIGRLEITGKGFSDLLEYTLKNIGDKNLILVIRDNLLPEVINKFGLKSSEVIHKQDIQKILDQ